MRFSELVVSLNTIRDSSLVQASQLAMELLATTEKAFLPQVVAILGGYALEEERPLPPGLVERAISLSSGWPLRDVRAKLRLLGDLPHTAESILGSRTQLQPTTSDPSAEEVLAELETLSNPELDRRTALRRLTGLLARLEPSSARLALELLLHQSKAYLRESALTNALASRLEVDDDVVRSLRQDMGWGSVARCLLGELSRTSKGIVRGSRNGKEGGQ